MNKFKHELGMKAKDVITGLKGIITGRVEYLTGCNQYAITPEAGKDNTMQDSYFIDESRIKVTSKKPIKLEDDRNKEDGGPVRRCNRNGRL